MSRFCKPPGSLAPSTCGKEVRTNPGRSAREDFSRVRPRCSSGNWWSLPVSHRTLPVFSGPPSLDQPKLRKMARRQGIAPCRPVLETRPSARTSATCKWVQMEDSNLRPRGYEPRELPLLQSASEGVGPWPIHMVDPAEFASAPYGLKVRCAAVTPRVRGKVVAARGVAPPLHSLKGRLPERLEDAAKKRPPPGWPCH